MLEERAREDLISIAKRFGEATGVTPAAIGKRALNDTKFFVRINDCGTTFTVRTFDKLIQWLSDNWPDDAIWPVEVPRPRPSSHPNSNGAAA